MSTSTVQLGQRTYPVTPHGRCQHLTDSSPSYLARDYAALRQDLDARGYLFLRGVLPTDAVDTAVSAVMSLLAKNDLPASTDQGKLDVGDLTHTPDVLGVLEHDNLKELFGGIFGGVSPRTYDYKWLRAVKRGESTGFHTDSVYMGNGSQSLVTCWIPFMSTPFSKGGLAVMPYSHVSPSLSRVRDTYCRLDMDKDDVGGTGWFTEDPEELLQYGTDLAWHTAEYRPGDVVIFGLHTMHGSSVNLTDEWRVSCDVRWQPREEAVDPRWVRDGVTGVVQGHTKFNKRHDKSFYPVTMEEAKKGWGLMPAPSSSV